MSCRGEREWSALSPPPRAWATWLEELSLLRADAGASLMMMLVMRLGQHARRHLPKGMLGWRQAVAPRSVIAVTSERHPVQTRETQAVTKIEPHVTPHMTLGSAVKAAMRSRILRAMWCMSGSSEPWAVASLAGEVCSSLLARETPWCRKSRRGDRRSRMAPLAVAMRTAMRGDHGGRGGQR